MKFKSMILVAVLLACISMTSVAATQSAPVPPNTPTLPTDNCGVPSTNKPSPFSGALRKFLRAIGIMTAPVC